MKILNKLLNNFWKAPKKWTNSISYFLVIIFFIFLAWFSFFPLSRNHKVTLFQESKPLPKHQNQKKSAFQNIKLEAKAAYVFDAVKNKTIFELNADAQLPLASLTKIMTALVAEENLPPYLQIEIPREAILEQGDEGFLVGEQWLVSDIRDVMLVSSSNDAASALALAFNKNFNGDFVSLMNGKAKELGLFQTYFLSPTGLDLSKNTAGGYGSAKDIVGLLLDIVKNKPSLMETSRLIEIDINSRKFKNTNQIVNFLPGFVAGKTGFSDLAGGNLAVVVDTGYQHPLIIVVLGSTFEGRFSDVITLYKAALSDIINL